MRLSGIVFDLDGTLVDSKLNFVKMREDLGFPSGAPILEHLESLTEDSDKDELWKIIDQHEWEGAKRSTLFEGVEEFFQFLINKNLKMGILTRNSTKVAQYVVNTLSIPIKDISTREDVEIPKPNPEGLLKMAKSWNVSPKELIYVGDYIHDYEAGKNAGMKTLGFNQKGLTTTADYTFSDYNYLKENFNEIMKRLGFQNF